MAILYSLGIWIGVCLAISMIYFGFKYLKSKPLLFDIFTILMILAAGTIGIYVNFFMK